MIPPMILKFVLPKVIELVAKQFRLDKVLQYVEEDNELDEKVVDLEERIENLELMAHAPREFIICEQCKSKIKEKK